MKLHRIHVVNLNSLYGEHSIDVESDLRDAPLFLIMGPTGSGKSTLMDAVSLALFGETPRLVKGRTSGHVDEDDSRNVMSRGTGSCIAEVEFSKMRNGVRERYRATWTCQRAHRKPSGNMQSPQRSIEQLSPLVGTWTTLVSDSRTKVFQPVFDDVLEGLTVHDFKRSVLLAQGEFAAFLRSSEDERAAILERLTDTSAYKLLGQRANALRRAAETRLQHLDDKLEEVDVLPPEQERALREQVATLEGAVRIRKRQLAHAEAHERWEQARVRLAERAEQARAEVWEAAVALRDARPLLDELTLHERCEDAALVLDRRLKTQAALLQLEAARRDHEAALDALDDDAIARQEDEAGAALIAARQAWDAIEPIVLRGREVRTRLDACEANVRTARDQLARRGTGLDAQRATLREATDNAAAASVDAERAQAALAAARRWAPLVDQIPGLLADYRTVEHGRGELVRKLAQSRRRRSDLDALGDRVRTEQAALTEIAAEGAPLRVELEAAAALVATALDGAEDSRARRRALELRGERAASTLATLERARTAREHVDRVAARTIEARSAHAAAVEAEQVAAAALAHQVAEIGELRATEPEVRGRVDDLDWALSLTEARRRLEVDKPCPLCGSADHPYVHTHGDLDEELRQRVAPLRARLDELSANIAAAEARRQGLEGAAARAGGVAQAAAADVERRARDEAKAREELARVDHDDLDAAFRAATEQVDAVHALRARLDDAEHRLARATAAVDEHRRRHDTAAAALQASKATAAERAANLAQESTDLDAERHGIDARAAELVARLGALDLEVDDDPFSLQAALSEVQGRVARWQGAVTAAEAAERTAQAAAQAAENAAAAQQTAAAEHTAAVAEVDAREAEAEALRGELAAILHGADPDAVATAHTEAIDAASARAAEVAAARTRLDRERTRLTTLLEAVTPRIDDTRDALEGIHDELAMRLGDLDLSDTASLLANRLPAARAQALTQARTDLHARAAKADANRGVAERDLSEHLDARPLGEPVPDIGSVRRDLDDLLRQSGSLAERLGVQQRNREGHAALLTDRARALQVTELWRRMHRLIGERDGDRFKLFAQVLNLGELIGRANKRLDGLAPRYRLVPARDKDGEPRLAFAIIDRYQANQVRPLTTLSGGETFLVSLALALALADYRAVRMPIETLLLDEGFGTLDAETLDVALDALAQLQASGTQIGIISHLPGLQERVEARVVVTPVGNGRSEIRCEVGTSVR